MKKYIVFFSYPLISILFITIIFSILNCFNVFIPSFIYLILAIILFFITGYITGTKIGKNGLKNGLVIASSIITLFMIFSITNFHIKVFIYYLIIMLSIILGSIFGVNKKK